MPDFKMPFKSFRLLALGLLSLVGACDSSANKAKEETQKATSIGYVLAPEIASVAVTSTGDLLVTGQAVARGRVRLTTDKGLAFGVSADSEGRFQASLPQSPEGSFFDLAMDVDGRLMKAEGRLFVPPSIASDLPPKAVFIRIGAGSLPLWPQASLIALVDYDAGGGMAISGRAEAEAEVYVKFNTQTIGQTRANKSGVYSVVIPLKIRGLDQTVTLSVTSGTQSETKSIDFKTIGSFESVRNEAGIWYVNTLLPGGGTQTTLLF
jgi:hypothetical protein